jgi:phage-related minor tail protein
MADNSRSRGFAAKEQKLQKELDNLQSRYGKAKELLEEEGDGNTSRMKGAGRLLSQIESVKQQLKDLKKASPDGSTRSPQRRFRD